VSTDSPDEPAVERPPDLATPPTSTLEPTRVPATRHAVDKFRIRFRKDGSLRLLSHHDLLRTFERLLRRAGLPFHTTQGFNPRPRLVFALSLPLGVVGRAEVLELEMAAVVPREEVLQAIARQTPPGLAILEVKQIAPKASAQVRALCYGVSLPVEVATQVKERIPVVLASAECWVERTRPPKRRLDIRPFLRALRVTEEGTLEMELWLTQAGTARPEEVLTVLEIPEFAGDGTRGAVLERHWLELEDEQPVTSNNC
jgi:radical SAM-linked protein